MVLELLSLQNPRLASKFKTGVLKKLLATIFGFSCRGIDATPLRLGHPAAVSRTIHAHTDFGKPLVLFEASQVRFRKAGWPGLRFGLPRLAEFLGLVCFQLACVI